MGLISGFGIDLEVKESVKGIVGAVSEFSSRKVGALIVIQGEIGLEEFKENAVKIDAILSKQLLSAIFCHESPIHDGAVIVDRDRIEVAGAVLPLTINAKLVEGLGTRHRAALGLSERTDALVIVVSEETGGITLFQEGVVNRDINVGNLKSKLDSLLHQAPLSAGEKSQKAKSGKELANSQEANSADKKESTAAKVQEIEGESPQLSSDAKTA